MRANVRTRLFCAHSEEHHGVPRHLLRPDLHITIALHQDGVPLYETSPADPIVWADVKPREVWFQLVEGIPGAFLLHNVLTPSECSQFVGIAEVGAPRAGQKGEDPESGGR